MGVNVVNLKLTRLIVLNVLVINFNYNYPSLCETLFIRHDIYLYFMVTQ